MLTAFIVPSQNLFAIEGDYEGDLNNAPNKTNKHINLRWKRGQPYTKSATATPPPQTIVRSATSGTFRAFWKNDELKLVSISLLTSVAESDFL